MLPLDSKDDRDLIRIAIAAPNTPEGREASLILQHRSYLGTQRQNAAIVRLTWALAVFALVQAASAVVQAVAAYKSVPPAAPKPAVHGAPPQRPEQAPAPARKHAVPGETEKAAPPRK